MAKNYVDTVGTVILVDVGSDISTASTLQLRVRKPSGEEVTWSGILGPPNAQGKYQSIKYTVQYGDWDEPGWWSLQAYVDIPGWTGEGETTKFELKPKWK